MIILVIMIIIDCLFDMIVARDALIRYIDTTCCWGTGPAKKANIQTEAWSSIACIIESFVEYRVPMWNQVPHKGEYFTPLGGGYAPQPWEIIAQPIPFFSPTVEDIEVPYTSTVFTCPECHGHRRVKCNNCGGDGKLRCNICGGDGHITTHHDGKSERRSCGHCGGDGRIRCNHKGILILFILLSIYYYLYIVIFIYYSNFRL